MKEEDLAKPGRSDLMVRWVCNMTLKDRNSFDKLRDCLWLVSIRTCIQRGRLRWFGNGQRQLGKGV